MRGFYLPVRSSSTARWFMEAFWLAGHKPGVEVYMSFVQKYFPHDQDLQRERLTRQCENLRLVRDFQLHCMARADDPDIRKNYRNIANLLEQAIHEYQDLLARLESGSKK
jgi:hypothetical protein